MENKENQELEQIDFQRTIHGLLKQLRRLWWLVLVLTLLGGGLMFVRAKNNYRPMYQAQAVFSVSVSYGNGTDVMDYINYYDYAAAKLAAETFPYLIQSEAMTQRIKHELGVGYINGTITASSLGGNTNFFRLTVVSSKPEDAYHILLAVMELYPQISSQVIGQTQLTVNREPVMPKQPYNNFAWKRTTAVGAFFGAAAGMAFLLVLAILSTTVYKPDELKQYTNLPCLATVPDVPRKRRSSGVEVPLLLNRMDEEEPFCEAFRLLRLKLLRQMEEKHEKVILFTSSLPVEGKSTVAANTAMLLSQMNKRVLLIDGDLRIQGLKSTLDVHAESTGLAELLKDGARKPQFLAVDDSDLVLLAGDTPVRNPVSLLKQDRLHEVLDQLRQQFDYIVIDTPPCIMMADATSLCRYADRVVYVVRQDYASRGQITDGIQTMSDAGAKLAGFVFNRAGASVAGGYGYHYSYGRGYGYGKGYKYTDKKH